MSRFVPAFLVAVTRQTHSVHAGALMRQLEHSLLIAYNMHDSQVARSNVTDYDSSLGK